MGETIKTLANCDEIEFLRQTNKIRKSVQNWLTVTDIANIRKRVPKLKEIPEKAGEEERAKIREENDRLKREQVEKNMDVLLDAMLEEHPEETVEVMKLCCFVDPKDKTARHITYYKQAFTEMLGNQDVIDFFQSLMRLAKTFGLTL